MPGDSAFHKFKCQEAEHLEFHASVFLQQSPDCHWSMQLPPCRSMATVYFLLKCFFTGECNNLITMDNGNLLIFDCLNFIWLFTLAFKKYDKNLLIMIIIRREVNHQSLHSHACLCVFVQNRHKKPSVRTTQRPVETVGEKRKKPKVQEGNAPIKILIRTSLFTQSSVTNGFLSLLATVSLPTQPESLWLRLKANLPHFWHSNLSKNEICDRNQPNSNMHIKCKCQTVSGSVVGKWMMCIVLGTQ